MKKTLIALFFFLACACVSKAQGAFYRIGPFQQSGLAYVCPVPDGGTPCPSPVAIFSNSTLTTSLANPITMPQGATVSFWVATGQYILQFPASGFNQVVTIGAGGVSANTASIPGTPGISAIPVTSGLMAEYRMLPTESICAILDYSGSGNNATGCVGTSPTINAVTGGLHGVATGAVSLPAALNSAQTIQLFIGNAHGNGALIAGNGTTTSSLILLSTVVQQTATQTTGDSPFGDGARILAGWMEGGNNVSFFPRAGISGNMSVAWDMICDSNHSSLDTIYLNGFDTGGTTATLGTYNTPILAQRCSQGHQTTGNYQLGGIAAGSCVNYNSCGYYNGNIYYAVFYNRPLTSGEIAQNAAYMATAMTNRGLVPTPYNLTVDGTKTNLVIDGDSLSCAPCVSTTPADVSPYSTYMASGLLGGSTAWNISNQSRAGMLVSSSMQPGAFESIDPYYRPGEIGNTVVIWGGTNDGGVVAEAALQQYCQDRHKVGWKCIVVSMIDRTASTTWKNTYDTWMRANWNQFADGFVDLGAYPDIGADGVNANTPPFTSDHIHLRDATIANEETPAIQRAVNRIYGAHDFSSATVYAAAALAATATTAGSEAGSLVTITFGATPANCQAGNTVTIAGTTPAGYGGNYLIRTRTATQITYINETSGLGAITVQGTGVCPQQQDADMYAVLNFGAGNFTLETCLGLTGQNIYLKNINAGATTVVPFGAETIDGAASVSVVSKATLILQSILVSSAAGGCSWKQLSNN